ncbi:AAA family ATPase [Mycobacterium kansasii]|uniref:AAA family ATPase n=1 Tax=Mycobacterium kansasii TaxID=1768 RepID=UPI001E56BC7C|nr:AAA family ATPase [Mycobacterium kansasii]UGT89219.1 AAA family ATPase [Mycobacterium kansasii]
MLAGAQGIGGDVSATPYADAMGLYWRHGWRGVIRLPEGQKGPPPDGFTGYAGSDTSYADMCAWAEANPAGNVALRLPDNVIGLDVDAYGAKLGAQTLAAAVARWGALPPAWTTTSRDDGVSGIRMYRVPAGTRFVTELPGGGVEVIQRRHRYAVVWPSRHPEGRAYRWLDPAGKVSARPPSPDELAELPAAWVDGIRATNTARAFCLDGDALVMGALTDGAPTDRVAARLAEALGVLAGPRDPQRARYDATLRHVGALLRYGRQGAGGVGPALAELRDRYVIAVADDRQGGVSTAREEFNRMICRAGPMLATPNDRDDSESILALVDPRIRGSVALTYINRSVSEVSETMQIPRSGGPSQRNVSSDNSDTVSEATMRVDTDSDTSDTSDTGNSDVLGSMVDGAWLDAQDFPPLEYAVPGLISEGLGIIVGPPKAGKSWLVADLALAVAAGGVALGAVAVAQRPVLYLALEDGHRRLQVRFRRIMGDGQPIPRGVHVIVKATPDEALKMIGAFMRRHAPAKPFVVLDTLGKVKPPKRAGEDSYQVDYSIGSRLKALADEVPGSALLVVHHSRKAESSDFVDAVSGTNGIAGAADFVAVLVRQRHSVEATLSVTGRDIVEAEYALTAVSGVLWRLDGGTLAAAADAAEKRRQAGNFGDRSVEVLAIVAAAVEPISPTDVASKLGIDNDTVGKYLRRLANGGHIAKAGRGKYRAARVLPACEVCGEPMAAGQVSAHLGCEAAA